ncbi:Fe2+-dependent dioxygenase [Algiphilus sp.]|uniref:Fe2+-dependent dioxygenase n=1 Tax=Algiphilus sp. TaxID=1872431 RepID=UPI0032EFC339
MLAVAGVLDRHILDAIHETLADDAPFIDGGYSARGGARSVKHNEQLAPDSAPSRAIAGMIEQRLRAHPVVQAYARPRHFARIQVSRHRAGMGYGLHVDDARIDGVRTDLSFTCFLSMPEDYQGGALCVQEHGGERSIKLAAGDCLLYPASTLHRVEPVSDGERLVAVGWIASEVRDAEERAILYALDQALASLHDGVAREQLALTLHHIRGQLQRRWMDP